MTSPGKRTLSPWQKFLAGKTAWQRFIIQLGALAGALVAIAGAAFGGWKVIGTIFDGSTGTGTGAAADADERIQNGSDEASDLVELLFARGEANALVRLDYEIVFSGTRSNQLSLQYHCNGQGTCSTVTLIDTGVTARPVVGIENSRRFHGCWAVENEGLGLDTPGLKISLTYQGESCPG